MWNVLSKCHLTVPGQTAILDLVRKDMGTEATVAPEVMARYRRSALAREMVLQRQAEQRLQAAWSIARRAARLLKEDFGGTRVVAFGSLAHGAWFGPRSDVDLAVEGIPPQAFWRAWCALDRLDPTVDIDLVAIKSAPERLRDQITQQGAPL
jgi:predicted nucleotidyltransferase